MHNLKSALWSSMKSPPNINKKKFLDEKEAMIDPRRIDTPKPLPARHPLQHKLSIKKILKAMEKDVLSLEDKDYEVAKVSSHKAQQAALASYGGIIETPAVYLPKTGSGSSPTSMDILRRKMAQQQKPKSSYAKTSPNKIGTGKTPKKPEEETEGEEKINTGVLLGAYVRNPKYIKSKEEEEIEDVHAIKNIGKGGSGISTMDEKAAAAQGSITNSPDAKGKKQVPSNNRGKGKIIRKECPTRKLDQELLMFKQIFVQPRAEKLEELVKKDYLELLDNPQTKKLYVEKQADQKKIKMEHNVELNHSNMMNESNHGIRHLSSMNYLKGSPMKTKSKIASMGGEYKPPHQLPPLGSGSKIMKNLEADPLIKDLLDDEPEDIMVGDEGEMLDEVLEIVMKKFNSKIKSESESFFSQQIQVQPPEGLNATVAAPLTPGGGWAPSIPNTTNIFGKSSLKDMTIRAKAGVQAGDIQKEAHMSFCLGVMNEDKRKFREAIKFFKRFFFCARLLDDPVGAALALNRLGVAYHKFRRFDKSLQFHIKHKEFSDKENVFAAFYNIGISLRFLKRYAEAINHFQIALDWAIQRMDLESECVTLGQMGITNLTMRNLDGALKSFKGCYEICQRMRNNRLQLDCLLCLGYISYVQDDYQNCKEFFQQANYVAKVLREVQIAEQCICNIGIALGKSQMDLHQKMFSTLYETPSQPPAHHQEFDFSQLSI